LGCSEKGAPSMSVIRVAAAGGGWVTGFGADEPPPPQLESQDAVKPRASRPTTLRCVIDNLRERADAPETLNVTGYSGSFQWFSVPLADTVKAW
jgi:hypothetical protein